MEKKSLKGRIGEAKEWTKAKAHGTKTWCGEHKAEIVVFGPAIIGLAVEVIKTTAKKNVVNEERRLKENYIYDRRMGHHYELNRKLTNFEKLQLDHRKDAGEMLGDILNDMGVLK